jgi:histidyl-tRNA synthetase
MAAEPLPLQGMSDVAAPEVCLWQYLESAARRVFSLYDLDEIRTPVLERQEVFQRALGEGTDVVQKEMYAFEDRGGRRVALRPEGTAGVMRHLAGAGDRGADARLYYWGPMFRAERPQAGRRRQFHQVGVELLGPARPAADAECVALQVHLLREWGLDGFSVQVNTRGEPGDPVAVSRGLQSALEARRGEAWCDDCRRRMDANPLRVLDCKQKTCRALADRLPPVTSWMSAASREYLDEVLRLLAALGVQATPSPRLIRGLDYYQHTIWEITHPALGAQDALSGGGRYGIQMGGRTLEGVGFAIGIERVVLALTGLGVRPETFRPPPAAWLVTAGRGLEADALALAQALRGRGIACGADLSGRSMKAQMRAANRARAPWVVLLGETEKNRGVVLLKNMATGDQGEVAPDELAARLLPAESPA